MAQRPGAKASKRGLASKDNIPQTPLGVKPQSSLKRSVIFGDSQSPIQEPAPKAARMYEKALRKNDSNVKSSGNLENGTGESYNGSISHALKKGYWHTDLSKTQIKEVEKQLRQIGNPESTRITDTANWYSGRLDGEDLFVIYSAEDADNPAILYEKKAKMQK